MVGKLISPLNVQANKRKYEIPLKSKIYFMVTQLFKSLEFGNGSRMSDENPVVLESKYLQNKNGRNKL